jgi:molybdopterin-guanine dinucleotide biosynthesis protein A
MDRRNKGLLLWKDSTLAEHAQKTLKSISQVVYLSANEDLERYRAIGSVIEDTRPGFGGPLVAIESALKVIQTPWLLTLPCDTPFVEARHLRALLEATAHPDEARYIVCGEAIHPLVSLIPVTALREVQALLDREDRRVMNLWHGLNAHAIDLGAAEEPYFTNLNTPSDYQAACQRAY